MIHTSTILDGKGGVLQNKQIVIEGGKISQVADAFRLSSWFEEPVTFLKGLPVVRRYVSDGHFNNRDL